MIDKYGLNTGKWDCELQGWDGGTQYKSVYISFIARSNTIIL